MEKDFLNWILFPKKLKPKAENRNFIKLKDCYTDNVKINWEKRKAIFITPYLT